MAIADTPAADAAIRIERLSLRYDSVTVLKGIDLQVERGSIVGLVGRNGAGKSSLMNCLVGLTRPQDGAAHVLGAPSIALPDAVRERIGYVAQRPDLLEWLTVGEHVQYIGSFYANWSRERARALCLRFGLVEGARVRRLTPGEQQRLALVLALAHDPELLLLDEPVSSLDPLGRRDFLRLLFEGFEPRTAIISSHLLGDLERVISHVVFLHEGRVQLAGAWDEIVEQVRQVRSAQAIAELPGLLRSRAHDGQWQHLVDLRRYPRSALPTDRSERALNLDDLFEELQQ